MVGHKDAIQPDLFNELAPVVKRAAAKMLRKYALRLSRRRVICPEDLENVGWARVLSQMNHIETLPPCDCVKIKGCTIVAPTSTLQCDSQRAGVPLHIR
jgi:hypothetical protein